MSYSSSSSSSSSSDEESPSSFSDKFEGLTKIRIKNCFVPEEMEISSVANSKHFKNLLQIQKAFNKNGKIKNQELIFTSGVVVEQMFKASELKHCGMKDVESSSDNSLEIWKISNFDRKVKNLQVQSLLFIQKGLIRRIARQFASKGELKRLEDIKNETNKRKKTKRKIINERIEDEERKKQEDEENQILNNCILGKILLIKGVKVLESSPYATFKNKFKTGGDSTIGNTPIKRKKPKKGSAAKKTATAYQIDSLDDIAIIGDCLDFKRCAQQKTSESCREHINMGRIGIDPEEIEEKKMELYCYVHEIARKKELKRQRKQLSSISSTSIKRNRPIKSTYLYIHSVYRYKEKNIFINFKSVKKLRQIEKRDKTEKEIIDFKFSINTGRGKKMVNFQKEVALTEEVSKKLAKKGISTKEIKERTKKIVSNQGVTKPELGRGLNNKKKLTFDFSDSDSDSDSDEEGFEPSRKKRKIKK